MSIVDEQPMETVHLYVVHEGELPRTPDSPSILMAVGAWLCMLVILGIGVFSAAPVQEVSFTVSVQGFHLAPVSKSMRMTVMATGKGHTAATTATGRITLRM